MLRNELRQPYLEEFEGGGGETTATEETQSTETTETAQEQHIRVKYNHEELDLPYEEAVQHIQKGMNYDKAVERAKQEAEDAVYAGFGYEWKGKQITSKAEYDSAIAEQQMEERIRNQYSTLPDEIVDEIIAGKQFREKLEAKESETLKEKAQRERQETELATKQADNMEFLRLFKEENGRNWESADTLPKEVIEFTKQGKSLSDSYARYLVGAYKQKLGAQEVNATNAATSTGSVTGHGSAGSDHISFETFEANKGNQSWVIKNLDKINESRAKW